MFSALLALASASWQTADNKEFAYQCAVNMQTSASMSVQNARYRKNYKSLTVGNVDEMLQLTAYAKSILEQAGLPAYQIDAAAEEGRAKVKHLMEDFDTDEPDSKKAYDQETGEIEALYQQCKKVFRVPMEEQPEEKKLAHDPADHRPECAANYKALAQIVIRSTNANDRLTEKERGRRTMIWSDFELRAVQLLSPGANMTMQLPDFVVKAASRLSDGAMKDDADLKQVMTMVGACDAEFGLQTIALN
jgi:hypothetical protein